MKRLLLALVMVIAISSVHAGNLRDYSFSSDDAPTANPAYLSDVIYDALLFDSFSAENAILEKVPMYEAEKDFNTELQKQLIRYGVTIYDYLLKTSVDTSAESTVQSGTLEVDAVDDSESYSYEVNVTSLVSNVLSGEIEYFEFDDNFDESYVVVTLKLYNRDTGGVNWLTTLSGKAGNVVDYIADALTHEPIDNSLRLRIETQEAEVQEEISNRLPDITFTADPAEPVIEGDNVPTVKLNTEIESGYLIESWDIAIYDEANEVIKTFEGTGDVPVRTEWDLTDEAGNLVEVGKSYQIIVTVEDELGNIVSQPITVPVSEPVAE